VDPSLFQDPLPRLPRIQLRPGGPPLEITLAAGTHVFYGELPPSPVWTVQGGFPGPVIEVEKNQPLEVHWRNSLPTHHLLPEAHHQMLMGRTSSDALPEVRISMHLHGAAVPEAPEKDRFHNNDGWPDDWIVPGEVQISRYPNRQSPRTLWYHDHAMGATARNVVAGIHGMYLIHDDFERSLGLPSGDYEIPMVFSTEDFNDDGTLSYPEVMSAEVYGSSVPVNGKISPYLRVEPRRYRFRMLNAANARSFLFKLVDLDSGADGPELDQIGSDGGFLDHPARFNIPGRPDSPRLPLSPAERADVIVDFSAYAGKTLLLHNTSIGVAGEGELYIPNIMIFKVDLPLRGRDASRFPPARKSPLRYEISGLTTRRIVLDQVLTPGAPPVMLINGKVWEDPAEDFPKLGSTEVWEIVNPLPDSHPFHIHLTDFRILDRIGVDGGASRPPGGGENGWKDTVTLEPGTITRIEARFGPYPGRAVYHCHILEHEDMGMMRPFEIKP